MTCNSAIYTVNRTSTTLEANSQVPFGGVVRRFGPAIRLEGDAGATPVNIATTGTKL